MNNGETTDATRRLATKKQTPDVAYAPPENYLEIDVINPITHGIGNQRYTDYEVRMKVSSQISLFGTRDVLTLNSWIKLPVLWKKTDQKFKLYSILFAVLLKVIQKFGLWYLDYLFQPHIVP